MLCHVAEAGESVVTVVTHKVLERNNHEDWKHVSSEET